MLLLLAMVIAIVPVSDVEAASKKKKGADTITVSLAGYYDDTIKYEDEVLTKVEEGVYRTEINKTEDGIDATYTLVRFDIEKLDGKKLNGTVITSKIFLPKYWNTLVDETGLSDHDIQVTWTTAAYTDGKVTLAVRYDSWHGELDWDSYDGANYNLPWTFKNETDFDIKTSDDVVDYSKATTYYVKGKSIYIEYSWGSIYKNGKLLDNVWFARRDNYKLDIDTAMKLDSQSKKTFKKKCKTVPDYRLFKKNIKKYIGKQYKISNAYVLQIFEYDSSNCTWMHLLVDGNRYFVYMDGTNDILEGDYVNVWITPTSSGYYETVSGTQEFTVYALAKCVELAK